MDSSSPSTYDICPEMLCLTSSPLLVPSWRENHIEPLAVDVSFNSPEVRDTASLLLTPTVRRLPLTCHCVPPPSIQPLDDGSYLKRHLKLELDEKRRKR